jgi:hypothetical protein
MSFAFQRRRGTTSQHASFTGLNAELTVDTDKKTVVVHDGSTAGGTPLAKERNPLNAQTGTSYTLAATDKDAVVTASNSSAITVTINNSVFAAGDRITVVQIGAGQVTFAAGAGVTIVSTGATAAAPALRAQYSAATVIAQSASSFIIVGDVE